MNLSNSQIVSKKVKLKSRKPGSNRAHLLTPILTKAEAIVVKVAQKKVERKRKEKILIPLHNHNHDLHNHSLKDQALLKAIPVTVVLAILAINSNIIIQATA